MRHKKGRRRPGEDKSFWITYSDLMSSLLLVFVLVLFYSVFQYHDMNEARMAELDVLEKTLNAKDADLRDKQNTLDLVLKELDMKDEELENRAIRLTEQQKEYLVQAELLDDLKAALEQQGIELDMASAALADAKIDYNRQVDVLRGQKTELEQLLGVRRDLVVTLVRELERQDVKGANVDATGAIVFESDLLFDVGKSDIKDGGKAFLKSFMPNYLSVLMSEEFSKYVSEIIIEGHTDTSGDYKSNLTLSLARASSVLQYLVSDEFTGINAAQKEHLKQVVHPTGRSFMNPIIDEETGSIDMAASRRVVIKFRLNDEDAINNVIELLRNAAPTE